MKRFTQTLGSAIGVFCNNRTIRICAMATLLLQGLSAFSATPFSTASASFTRRNWVSSTAWNAGNTPPITGFVTNDNITVSSGGLHQSVKLAGTLNFQAGSNIVMTVAAGDTLIVDALNITSGCNIVINGLLIVNGNMTNTGGITVGNAIVVKGNLDNSGGTINNGITYTFGTVTNAGVGSSTRKDQAGFDTDYAVTTDVWKSVASSSSWLSFTWDGGGADDNWMTAANWDGDIAPVGNSSEEIIFAGSVRTAPANNFAAGTSFKSISFATGANSFTLSGNAIVLTGGTTAIAANNASNTMAINNTITFSTAAPTITVASGGTLTLGGTINNGGMALSLACAGTATISGIVAGTGALLKSGSGTITLSGANTFSGGVNLNVGTLNINNATALGTGTFTIEDNTSFDNSTGASISMSANNPQVWNGNFTFVGSNDLNLGTGNVTLSAIRTVTVNGGNKTLTIGGVISGTGGITRLGVAYGSLYLTGANTYSGVNTVTSGLLVAGHPSALGATSAGTIVSNTGQLILKGFTFDPEPLTINGNFNNVADFPSALRNSLSGSSSVTWTGPITLGSDAAIGCQTAGDVLNVTGVVSGGFSLTKVAAGTLKLSGTNTYTGSTVVNGGVLQLNNTAALGTTANGTAIASGAALDLNGVNYSSAEALSINGTGVSSGGAIYNSSATAATYAGLITLTGSSSIIATAGDVTITNAGTITGAGHGLTLGGGYVGTLTSILGTGTGTLTKQDAGRWILNGANTYTGETFINAGQLSVGTATALGTVDAGTVVASGAFLDLNGINYSTLEPLTLNGTGVAASGALANRVASPATFAGLISLASDAQIAANTGSIAITNPGTITGNFELTITGSSGGTMSSILGNKALVKNGTGTWTLLGANTYTETTNILNGVLKLGNTSALGSVASGTIIAPGASLDLNGIAYPAAEPITIEGTGYSASGAIFNSNASDASFPGAITLSNTATITADNKITLSGAISPSTQNLSKAGTSSLVFTNNTISVNNLAVSAGTLEGGTSAINIYGDFTCAGTFTPNTNTVLMRGAATQSLPAVTFNNLTINNSSVAGVTMTGNVSVSGTLTMTDGILSTGANAIDLGATGDIVEAAPSLTAPTSYVTGTVKATRNTGSTSGTVTFGGIGLEITETTKTDNSTVVTRVTGTACSGAGNTGIERYFTITPVNDVALNGTMSFYYFDHEIPAGQAEANLDIYKSSDGRTTWSRFHPTRDEANNKLTLTGITSFSDWTASDGETSSLPISLIDFSAKASQTGVMLSWRTASEINNDYFTVERSTNGTTWETITQVSGAGNATIVSQYGAFDNPPHGIIVYYRLKQTDFDGNYSYSSLRSVFLGEVLDAIDIVYCAKRQEIIIKCDAAASQNITSIKVSGVNGNVFFKSDGYVPSISMANVPAGLYLVVCTHRTDTIIGKIIVEQ